MEEIKSLQALMSEANKRIRLVDIKGKLYAPVSERVKAFRSVYPDGTIETEMLQNEDGVAVFRAAIKAAGETLATGTAFERENGSYINKTSYIENCETSAVGRALGFAGFGGIDCDVASAEEVANAQLNDTARELINEPTVKALRSICDKNGWNESQVAQLYGKDRIEDMTNLDHADFIERMRKKGRKA